MGTSEKAVLKTLLYSDVFSFPLTLDELYKFLISETSFEKARIKQALENISSLVESKNGFFCLRGKKSIITSRIEKRRSNVKKQQMAIKFSQILSKIPSVSFIGISGGVAVSNADKKDDIDFFVITKKNTLWTSRLIILLLLEIYGVRRQRVSKRSENKLCVNMFVDSSSLSFSQRRQNVYTAREIVQLLPLFDRDRTYDEFMISNMWVKRYLANMSMQEVLRRVRSRRLDQMFQKLCMILNIFAKYIQLISIKRNQTIEEVSDTLLAFHPHDYASVILDAYEKKIQRAEKLYNIPLRV